MHLLTLGGSRFLSRAVVDEALRRGHEVTAVTRGRSGEPPAGARAARADRNDTAGLAAAVGELRPDAVVDTSTYDIAGAHAAAEVLGHVPAYAFVSTLNAYRDWPDRPLPDEDCPTWDPATSDVTEYGPMKAASERILAEVLGPRLLVARAGLIIGPGDRTRRLTSWLHRIATDARVVVPATLDQPLAFVDVRDLAAWLVTCVEQGVGGPVNATGPAGMTTFGGLLGACADAVTAAGGTTAELVPVPDADLLAAGVEPWRDLPFWLPAELAATAWDVGTATARRLGLATRPVEETVSATWAWLADEPDELAACALSDDARARLDAAAARAGGPGPERGAP